MSSDHLASVWWFWRDWRASKARACMSPLARGVYRELLDAHYAEDDCALPDDDAVLAALAGVTLREWLKVKDQVLPWIPLNADGRRQNARALAEWTRAHKDRDVRRAKASRGGVAKAEAERKRATSVLGAEREQDQAGLKRASSPAPAPAPASSPSSHTDPDARGYTIQDPNHQAQTAGRARRPEDPENAPAGPRIGAALDVAGVAHHLELVIGCSYAQAAKAVGVVHTAGAGLDWILERVLATAPPQTPWQWQDAAAQAWKDRGARPWTPLLGKASRPAQPLEVR